jgi:transcriptional regulator with XRE-family HTH domain
MTQHNTELPYKINGDYYAGFWRIKAIERREKTVNEIVGITVKKKSKKPIIGIETEQAGVVRVIGQRLKEAREMCNLSLTEAARRLGYENPSKLSKIEGATCGNSVPHRILVRAALTYSSSMDFFYGLSDEWERDVGICQERDIAAFINEIWEKRRVSDINIIRMLFKELSVLSKSFNEIAQVSVQNRLGYERFLAANPEFLEMAKSNNILRGIESLELTVHNQRALLKKYVRSCREMKDMGDLGDLVREQIDVFETGE